MKFRSLLLSLGLGAMALAAQSCSNNSACTAPDGGSAAVLHRSVSSVIETDGLQAVDLLVAVDNSNSMGENQANIMSQFGPLISTLTNPGCVNTSNPVPHPCVAGNVEDRPVYPPVRDLHVGVVSSDLGTPGSTVPGCANSDNGDDGWLNPIRHGQALQRHLPWTSAPAGFRPSDCTRADQYPSFIAFRSGATGTDPATFEHDFRCNAGLYVNGCGLEQQLESVWRALIWHDARVRPGNTDMNAGFLRDDALLAIVVLSDEEDGSVRDCRYARGEPCNDAIDVFNQGSSRWSSPNLNLRFYMSYPGSDQDPTWNLDRYINPADPSVGFLGLKPGHPERVLFAAITGVPLAVPTVGTGSNTRIVWDRLLGTPAGNPNDYAGRNAGPGGTAIDEMSNEGPISMRQANADTNCTERTVPACRREGTTYDPANPPCTTTAQYFAWPARRLVEVARRFDEAPLCHGGPCNNGVVTSICSNDYQSAVFLIVRKIQNQLIGRSLTRILQTTRDSSGNDSVACSLRMTMPETITTCDAANGRQSPIDGMRTRVVNGVVRTVCDVHQLSTRQDTTPPGLPQPDGSFTEGWWYDTTVDPSDPTNRGRISFTEGAARPSDAIVNLECADATVGVSSPGGGPASESVCSNAGVGAACNPQHPPYTGGASCAPDSGCFVGYELYIETSGQQCRTGACMVYHWNEEIEPAERSRVFCTCRCGGVDSANGSFCTCGEGFTCTTAFLSGPSDVRGAYCVRDAFLGTADAGR